MMKDVDVVLCEDLPKQKADPRPAVLDAMEPGVGGLWAIDPTAMFLASIAISLKRIRQNLENRG
jgi:hypothetical protein